MQCAYLEVNSNRNHKESKMRSTIVLILIALVSLTLLGMPAFGHGQVDTECSGIRNTGRSVEVQAKRVDGKKKKGAVLSK